jgi:ankyrin repeat protein
VYISNNFCFIAFFNKKILNIVNLMAEIVTIIGNMTSTQEANMIDRNDNWSVLMHACIAEDVSAVKKLLSLKSNINYVCPLNWTALCLACVYKRKEIIEILIEAGANINQVADKGFTALAFLMINPGNELLISYLISKGADMDYAMKHYKAGQIPVQAS